MMFKIYDIDLKVITLIGHLNIQWVYYNYGFSAKSPHFNFAESDRIKN